MFRAILNAIKNGLISGLEAIWGFCIWAANVPVRFFAGAMALGQGVAPNPAGPRGEGEDAAAASERVEEALDRVSRSRITAAAVAAGEDPRLPAGRVVHHYALADTYERDEVDLSSLKPEQLGWLVMLTETELTCLAAAGPDVCERFLNREKTSLKGKVPEVGPASVPAREEPEAKEDLTFAQRLRRFKKDPSLTPRWA